jgi:lysyl-tRNA synthetase class 2
VNRHEFLQNYWRRFPVVTDEVIDCAMLTTGSSLQRVGGRLTGRAPDWYLRSAGQVIQVEFSFDTHWSQGTVTSPCDFDPSILTAGDLVWFLVEPAKQNRWRVKEVALLFAADSGHREYSVNITHDHAQLWASFTNIVRSFFLSRGFLEVRTPTLVASPGTEPFLDPFATETFFGSRHEKMFLPTSPEFHLKKLLVAGFTKIFEFKECFRNKEQGSHHQPEFLMLEWYRAFASIETIARDCEELVDLVSRMLANRSVNLKRVSVAELFAKHLSFKLTPETQLAELLQLARNLKVQVAENDSWDEVYFRIFLEKIEPHLKRGLFLVNKYPPSQAALARITQDGWADRFEIYWNGIEIANAFHELNDPQANEARFKKDAEDARAQGKTPVPVDYELLRALKTGMPPSGGIALGMDRLFMAVLGIDAIENTRAFPFK